VIIAGLTTTVGAAKTETTQKQDNDVKKIRDTNSFENTVHSLSN